MTDTPFVNTCGTDWDFFYYMLRRIGGPRTMKTLQRVNTCSARAATRSLKEQHDKICGHERSLLRHNIACPYCGNRECQLLFEERLNARGQRVAKVVCKGCLYYYKVNGLTP